MAPLSRTRRVIFMSVAAAGWVTGVAQGAAGAPASLVHEAQLLGLGDIDATGAQFGGAVSLSGDTVIVGVSTNDTPAGEDAGSAYVFVRSGTTWTLQQKLLAPDGAAGDVFGIAVSVCGDTVVVGACPDDTPAAADA